MYFWLQTEQDMKNYTKKILRLVLLLSISWLQLSVIGTVGKPLPGCSQISEIERYDPTDPGANITCIRCPECPEGQGLFPQCGTRVTKDIKIHCIQCQANESYSDTHGIESCKACQKCGLKDVTQHCTLNKNRICGTKCPQGYFLDHNHICQECYFCCDNVSEAQRRQGCKDIGMTRNWQCEKTEQNQRCLKEALAKVTNLPTTTKPTAPHDHNTFMTNKLLKPQVHDNATSAVHHPTKTFTRSNNSNNSQGGRTRKVTNDASISATPSPKRENGQELYSIIGGVLAIAVIAIISALALRSQFCRFSRTNNSETTDSTELTPLSICESTDSARTSEDNLTNEVSAKEVDKPNAAHIPADCYVSEMDQLCDNKGKLMLFHVQRKLDVVETLSRKTWRSVGRALKVSSDDLDLIETDYKAGRSPTESLLEKFKNLTAEPTMGEFVQALVICNRNDVASYICNWPWEKRSKSVESENPREMVHQPA